MKVTYQMLIGVGKEECEDSALIFDHKHDQVIHDQKESLELKTPMIIAIADGVGGNPGGRDASTFALTKLKEMFHDLKTPFKEELIKEKIKDLNRSLVEYSAPLGEKDNMATTFTALFFDEEKMILAHTGNTRLNAFNNGFLKQLNTDHSTYQYYLELGNFEAAENCNHSEIYSFLGGGDVNGMRRLEIKAIPFDQLPNSLILTSDGIHEYVELDDFEAILDDASITTIEKTSKLIQKALENLSGDDKTVVIIEK